MATFFTSGVFVLFFVLLYSDLHHKLSIQFDCQIHSSFDTFYKHVSYAELKLLFVLFSRTGAWQAFKIQETKEEICKISQGKQIM